MATSYYATRLSENIGETPEGYRICLNVVIGRTGFQTYTVGNLNQDAAKRLGIDVSNPSAEIELFRPAEEVFSTRTLASFEGKPVTLDHPATFVNPDTFRDHARGHATKIRKGDEVLEDGNWPLMADLIITDAELIRQIDAGRRELSCGYQYELASDGHGQFLQTSILGNHIAVVDQGRAGAQARIYDSVDSSKRSETEVKPLVEEAVQAKPVGRQFISKEKGKHMSKPNWLKRLTGLGIQAMAKDAETKPEDLADAFEAVRAFDSEESEEEKAKKAKDAEEEKKREEDRKAKDAKYEADKAAKDAEEAERKKKEEEDRKAKDAAEQHHQPCGVKDCAERDCRMHGALDSILKAHPAEKGEDADMKELGELLSEFMKEETSEGGSEDDEDPDFIEPEMDEKEPELVEHDSQPGRSRAGDAIDTLRANRTVRQRDKERAELRALAPTVARSGDSKQIASYNERVRRFRASGTGAGGYDKFAAASAAIEGLPSGSPSAIEAHNQAYEKMCADERKRPLNGKGGK
jgi:hypothetical protein